MKAFQTIEQVRVHVLSKTNLAVWTLDGDTELFCSFSCSHSITSDDRLRPGAKTKAKQFYNHHFI
jgi:hypothetical protein